jgi:hypothetical protein
VVLHGMAVFFWRTRYVLIWYMLWFDMIWCDMIWYDLIWFDIWYDMVWYDMIWFDTCYDDLIWCDMIWYELILYDMIWYDMIWYDIHNIYNWMIPTPFADHFSVIPHSHRAFFWAAAGAIGAAAWGIHRSPFARGVEHSGDEWIDRFIG